VLSLRGEGLMPVVVGPGRSGILIPGGLQQTSVCRLGCRRKTLPFWDFGLGGFGEPHHLAATSVTAVASSQLAPLVRATAQQAVSTTEMCWVAPYRVRRPPRT
jgi:hypothetical protein